MELVNLGWPRSLDEYLELHPLLVDWQVGRIITEHKERYLVRTTSEVVEAVITGQLHYNAKSREDFPAVGDWVALSIHDQLGIIHQVLPRHSLLKRQAAGHYGEAQVIAANIDFAFIVQAAGHDYNLNRLERYLTICYNAKIQPLIIFTKIDLLSAAELNTQVEQIKHRLKDVPIFPLSNFTKEGLEKLRQQIQAGKTYCFIGSSGVGKSSLINNLAGTELMSTAEVSTSTAKGKHQTTHRELILLNEGGLLIDNPGMREVGLTESAEGLEKTFDVITQLAEACKYQNCTHVLEAGCAVMEAIEAGQLEQAVYENYLKLYREQAYFETTTQQRRQKERMFGKLMKNFKKDKRNLNKP